MKMSEENSKPHDSHGGSGRGRNGGRGRGRGRCRGKSGRGSRTMHQHDKPTTGQHTVAPITTSGRGSGNHSRHPRQTSKSHKQQPYKQQHKQQKSVGRGRGRPRSASNDDHYAAKKSIEGPYSYLFCSERYGFALSRFLFQQNQYSLLHPFLGGQNYPKITSDQLEAWWEAVKLVRCHVPYDQDAGPDAKDSYQLAFLERCPICLDEAMISPFIAPCGHAFCLPCILGYLSSVAKDLNSESERLNKNKQKRGPGSNGANGVVGSSGGSINYATVTTVRARCPLCSSGSSTVLNAGEAMITYKDLRPVVFVPVVMISAASADQRMIEKGKKNSQRNVHGNKSGTEANRPADVHTNSSKLGTRMKFVKLHRVKGCPAPYLPLKGNRIRGSSSFSTASDPGIMLSEHLPDLPDGDDDTEECIYARQYFVGLEEYARVLQCDQDDLINYKENDINCQLDPKEAWNVSMAIEAIQASQRRWFGCNEGAKNMIAGAERNDSGFRTLELAAKDRNSRDYDRRIVIAESAREQSASFVEPNHEVGESPYFKKEQISLSNSVDSNIIMEPSMGEINDESMGQNTSKSNIEESDITRKSSKECKPINSRYEKQKKNALLKPGSAYLNCDGGFLPSASNLDSSAADSKFEDNDEFLYYQSSDGQLCFLSGIDVACLSHEFSLYRRAEDSAANLITHDDKQGHLNLDSSHCLRNSLPLPDELTGTVIGIEREVVTHTLIKRKPFLSHIPPNSSVSFIEVDWYSGGEDYTKPMLSHGTLSKFRGELQRRKSERLRVAKMERKADMAAKAKSEKEERRRRQEALGSAYFTGEGSQTIDPDDDFFQVQSAPPDDSKEVTQWVSSPVFRFNEVCATGGVWPELSLAAGSKNRNDSNVTPSPSSGTPPVVSAVLSSSPPPVSQWGRNPLLSSSGKPTANNTHSRNKISSDFPSLAASSLTTQIKCLSKTQTNQHEKLPPSPSVRDQTRQSRPWG